MTLIRATLLIGTVLATPAALAVDLDADGIDDTVDNCLEIPNSPSEGEGHQCDTDRDGIGNHCDADLDNNCIVNSFDLTEMRTVFGQSGGLDADLDCNTVVNSFDLSRMRGAFGRPPGPSARSNLCDGVKCDEPRAGPAPDAPWVVPLRWPDAPRTGDVVEGSSVSTMACNDGVLVDVVTNGLVGGNAYTMWIGWFENPEDCLFTEPWSRLQGFRCGFLDLFRFDIDANFVWADGGVATGLNDTFDTFVAAGVPYTGDMSCPESEMDPCKSQQVAHATNDSTPAVLVDPLTAEYHVVFINHGPDDPDYPEQTTSHDGGCELHPTNPGPHDCRGEQVSAMGSMNLIECDQPECLPWLPEYPFVAGTGSAEDFFGERWWVEIVTRQVLDSPPEGTFRAIHTDASGVTTKDLAGSIGCVDVQITTDWTAYTTGTIEEVMTGGAAIEGEAIAITITDDALGDRMGVNIPSESGVPNLPIPGSECEAAPVQHPVDEGNFYVSD